MANPRPRFGWTDADAKELMASADDYPTFLRTLRDRLAAKVADPDVAARDLASLSRHLVDVSRELKAISRSEATPDPIDEIQARRRRRMAGVPLALPTPPISTPRTRRRKTS